ncbi:MAG: DNA ligase D [Thermoleophilia bacterium]
MSLGEYKRRRRFDVTPEPTGGEESRAPKPTPAPRFVIQKHDASTIHYDLRLEHDGVLKSWAVPKGLATPHVPKKLAVHVEDHPLEYIDFSGEIPAGEYGAGTVEIWDEGTFEPLDDFSEGLESGKLTFRLSGARVTGEFSLVRMKGKSRGTGKGKADNWLVLLHKKGKLNPDLLAEGVAAEMPARIQPMQAVLGDRPFSSPDFIYEIKFDGVRALAFLRDDGTASLVSRNQRELTTRFPELADIGAHFLAGELIVDGEIAALDERGISRFQLLQSRINLSGAVNIEQAGRSTPAYYYVFDILYLDGRDLTMLPLERRKEILARIFMPHRHIRPSETISEQGEAFFRAAGENGLEGIMAKRKSSSYQQKRSRDWIKLKVISQQEFVIGGYTRPRGPRSGFGALLIGYYDGARLIYAGHVGSGFNEDMLKDLYGRMKQLKRPEPPFDKEPKTNEPAQWIEPELVAEIKFTEWTRDGNLRHPVFLGLRSDVDAREVVREETVDGGAATGKAGDTAVIDTGGAVKPALVPLPPPLNGSSQTVDIDGRRLNLTHLDKVFWPEEGYTKQDLISYYRQVSAFIIPHLSGRPLTLKRYPDGYGSEPFFQKEVPQGTPDWVRTEDLPANNPRKHINYVICDDLPTLCYLANIACISQNPWLSLHPDVDKPDILALDIDPPGPGYYDQCVEIALLVRDKLAGFGLKSYPKTSGATGIHVYVPINPVYTYEQARQFAQIIATLCREDRPDLITLETSVSRRQERIYLDYLQNSMGKTLASVYSVRAQPGATVSMPLEWREVRQGLLPGDFTIANVPERLALKGDLFAPVLTEKQDLLEALAQGEHFLRPQP